MEKVIIDGGSPLEGTVTISGMKNAAVAVLYATVLVDGVCVIENLPNISDTVCDELGLSGLFDLKNSSLSEYFTTDPEVIEFRQKTLTDMIRVPELKSTLAEINPILDDIQELRRLDRDRGTNAAESYLYSITEVELYVSCIDILSKGFSAVKDRLTSPAFIELSKFVFELSCVWFKR